MLDSLRLARKEEILEETVGLICYIVFELDMTGGFSGRKLFVGGLPPKVDDKALHDVFSRFWHIEEGLYSKSALRSIITCNSLETFYFPIA